MITETTRICVTSVIRDQVEDEPNASLVQGFHDLIEIIHCAEAGIDRAKIGNVIAEIFHGRAVDWREPDGRYTKPGEMIEPRQQARKIARSIAVRVLERHGIDLVVDAPVPPRQRTVPGQRRCPRAGVIRMGRVAGFLSRS